MKKYSNDEIIKGIREHDEEVLRHIYQDNFKKIRQLVCTNSGNPEDAADVFQESLIVIFNKIRNNNFILTASFDTYFYSVAKNVWKAEYRKKNGTILADSFSDEIITDEEIQHNLILDEKFKLVWTYFEKLTADCQKVIRLFLDGHSTAEVTEKMNYNSEQHTKNRKYRCKETLIRNIINDPKYREFSRPKNDIG